MFEKYFIRLYKFNFKDYKKLPCELKLNENKKNASDKQEESNKENDKKEEEKDKNPERKSVPRLPYYAAI